MVTGTTPGLRAHGWSDIQHVSTPYVRQHSAMLIYNATLCVSVVFAVVRPSVRPSRSCIISRRLKISSNFFFWHRSAIVLLFPPQAPLPNSKKNPFSGGRKYTQGWEKLAIFDCNRRLSRNRYEIGPRLLWNVNRKSSVPDRYVSVPMTFSDLERRDADLRNNASTV